MTLTDTEILILLCAGYLTQAAGLITTDASRASFISTFTVGALPSSVCQGSS